MERGKRKEASKVWNGEVHTSRWSRFSANECQDGNKAGELWAIALSEDGQYLASTAYDGRINVWDLGAERVKIREFETKGSFGMCIDMVRVARAMALLHYADGLSLVRRRPFHSFWASEWECIRFQ